MKNIRLTYMETWNKRIARRREELGISKAEFARRCGVSAPTVNDWENGDIKELSGPKLLKVCEALDLDPWEVVVGKPRVNPPKREVNQPLSDEAELLIQCVMHLDGLGATASQMFALHASLLRLAEPAMGMQDGEVVRELHIEEQKLASHVDPLRTHKHAKRDHKIKGSY
jgi:transcriptional regulator with XRE-family HTH domain